MSYFTVYGSFVHFSSNLQGADERSQLGSDFSRLPLVDSYHSRRISLFHLKNRRTFTLFTIIHAKMNKIAHLCMNGLMDTNSVKNGATVTDMRQKLNYTDYWHGSRLACQANYWTAYASLARTNRLSNHTIFTHQRSHRASLDGQYGDAVAMA